MPSNEAGHNLLSNERLDTFWDALWLELWPFLYFIVESHRIACRWLQTKRGAICYRMSVSPPSGTACGSSYGRFCIFVAESRRIACRCLQTKRGAICYRMSVSTPSGTPCGSSYGRFCVLWQNRLESHGKHRPPGKLV